MIKLKTLKDFENSKWLDNNMPYGESSEGYEKEIVFLLRKQAIKIIKKKKEITTADWVEFFNITGEELK